MEKRCGFSYKNVEGHCGNSNEPKWSRISKKKFVDYVRIIYFTLSMVTDYYVSYDQKIGSMVALMVFYCF